MNNDLIHIIESFDFNNVKTTDISTSFTDSYFENELKNIETNYPKTYLKMMKIKKELSTFLLSYPQYVPIMQNLLNDEFQSDDKKVVYTKEELQHLIESIIRVNPKANLNFIDVSHITDMSGLFNGSQFNGDISKWNVSNVTNMSEMFAYSRFNGDISKWNVSNVTDMSSMFDSAVFNGDLSKWDVSHVKNMEYMFEFSKFNNDISKWNTSNVTRMRSMFRYSKFNGDISNWNVSKVSDAAFMFEYSKFCQDISNWQFSKKLRNKKLVLIDSLIKDEFKPIIK